MRTKAKRKPAYMQPSLCEVCTATEVKTLPYLSGKRHNDYLTRKAARIAAYFNLAPRG